MTAADGRPSVLFTASSDWLGVARLSRVLAAAGCRVAFLGHPYSMAARSRYVDELIPGSWEPEANLEILRRRLEGGAAYAWIILADDASMAAAARLGDREWLSGWFPVDPFSEKPGLLVSKSRFVDACVAAGLPVPRSIPAASADRIRAAALEIGFPVIVKPSAGSGGEGIFVAESLEELDRRIPVAGSFVVQRRVVGVPGGTIVLFDRGRPTWWMSSMREEVWPEPFGPSSTRVCLEVPGIQGLLEGVGELLGMTGLCEIDWVLGADGGPCMLEFNPRPPSYLYAASRFGGDLPEAILALITKKSPACFPAAEPGARIRLFPEDFIRALHRRDYARCARWLFAPGWPLPWDDPALFLAYVRPMAKAFLKGALFRP